MDHWSDPCKQARFDLCNFFHHAAQGISHEDICRREKTSSFGVAAAAHEGFIPQILTGIPEGRRFAILRGPRAASQVDHRRARRCLRV